MRQRLKEATGPAERRWKYGYAGKKKVLRGSQNWFWILVVCVLLVVGGEKEEKAGSELGASVS
jgi:hypothetical protein